MLNETKKNIIQLYFSFLLRENMYGSSVRLNVKVQLNNSVSVFANFKFWFASLLSKMLVCILATDILVCDFAIYRIFLPLLRKFWFMPLVSIISVLHAGIKL